MTRILVLYNKPADTGAFDRYYYENHVPIAKRMPGLRSYIVSAQVPGVIAGGEPPYLVAELDFDIVVPGHGPVQHGRTTLSLFRDYLTELNQFVREGISAGKSLATLQAELAPERFRSLYNHEFGQTFQRNREALLGLPPGQPLGPVISSEVEQIYYYYTRK